MWWHDDDDDDGGGGGGDDSPLVGNQREERIIIKQLNYSAISPRRRQPLRGSSLKLIWEACGAWRASVRPSGAAKTPPPKLETGRGRGGRRGRPGVRRSGGTQGWRGRGSRQGGRMRARRRSSAAPHGEISRSSRTRLRSAERAEADRQEGETDRIWIHRWWRQTPVQ